MNVIEVCGLSKVYGKKAAVDHFDMQVAQGDIYGFVGRNGAGKSTVIKMLSGLVHSTSGEISLFGQMVSGTGSRQLQRNQRMGVLIENPGIYPRMNAFDNMMEKALCLGVVDPKKKSEELLSFVGLAEVGKKNTARFSMGMKQRLGLALALLGDPDLLLLDEPLNGLDPEGAREIRRLIIRLNEERNMTVVISSHDLSQLGKMVTCYGVIREGRMVRELPVAEVEQECSDFVCVRAVDQALALATLQEKIINIRFQAMPDGSLHIFGACDAERVGFILQQAEIAVQELYVHQRDLEEFFVAMMGDERHV